MKEPKHCDEYIDDKTQPEPLRKFLAYARAPGHGHGLGAKPQLFATVACPDPKGLKHLTKYRVKQGARVKVNMASRFGDVGIANNHEADYGYDVRVPVEWLTDFSEKASA